MITIFPALGDGAAAGASWVPPPDSRNEMARGPYSERDVWVQWRRGFWPISAWVFNVQAVSGRRPGARMVAAGADL